MLDHLLYLAATSAPELAEGAAEAGGALVEQVGRRLAAGLCEELQERAQRSMVRLEGLSMSSGLDAVRAAGAQALLETPLAGAGIESWVTALQPAVVQALNKTLGGEGLTLVSTDDLAQLRAAAAKA